MYSSTVIQSDYCLLNGYEPFRSSKHVRVDDMTLKVQLWDIAGQDRFIGLAPTYYRHAVAAIVAFDITNASSLQNARKWKIDVDDKVFLRNGDNIPVVLFANKVE